MAKLIDSLRKFYSKLTPFERINFLVKALTVGQPMEMVEALAPPTLPAAWKGSVILGYYNYIAGFAVTQSLKAHGRSLTMIAISGTINQFGNKSEDAFALSAREHNYSEAWVTALARLEKETGAALLDVARSFDRGYVDNMLKQAEEHPGSPVNNDEQFNILREMWQSAEKILAA